MSCKDGDSRGLSAQEIVDKSIEVCGGDLYKNSQISFDFRDKTYTALRVNGRRVLKRIYKNDSIKIVDVKSHDRFERYKNDSLIIVHDTLANAYSNSINSVHYFAYLPFGLNDPAVRKTFLDTVTIKNQEYFKIKVTFDQNGGGKDFDDVYVYWINTQSFKPDYLAYEFHVDGGGMRFREAYNERIVNGIRFVDYKNYKSKDQKTTIFQIDSLFANNELELLSTIELTNISVQLDNYN